jgi:type VI secretion system protein ImpH
MKPEPVEIRRAAESGSQPALWDKLRAHACEFDFFQAVWLFERFGGGDTLVGQRGPVARERLRFRPELALGFPSTDVRRMLACRQPDTDDPYYLLEIAFLGLYGVSTPLPLHYAVDILRGAERSTTPSPGAPPERPASGSDTSSATSPVRDFLDIFHHRIISLFYRSWLKYRYERMFAAPDRDALSTYLCLFNGCPPAFDEPTLGLSPIRLLRYVGVLTQRPRSATTLAGVLFDYWDGIPVDVRQFVGQWVPLEEADQNRFGLLNCELGVNLTIGDQVYDLGGAFNIVIGPVDWETYLSFVPGGFRFNQTPALVKLYCADPLAFTFELKLCPGQVPQLQLSSGTEAAALGLTSWVRSGDLGQTSVTFAASEETNVRIGLMPATAASRAA